MTTVGQITVTSVPWVAKMVIVLLVEMIVDSAMHHQVRLVMKDTGLDSIPNVLVSFLGYHATKCRKGGN